MSDVAQKLENMIPFQAASAEIVSFIETEDGVMYCFGKAAHTVLEDTTDVYAPGCIYIKSLTAGTSVMYFNVGTKAAPDFDTATWS
ncbi:unnamed protein product [marine sediment metagenome]|uniref:Uncharacterized protein n=1 Tax=marine sediment metagenome TaxID=412755 RepID=X0U3Z4_9ZZZZ